MGLIPSRNPWQQRTISLQGDLACVHCTYNLRGLAISGTCPECGQRIWDSFLAGGVSALKQATQRAGWLCFVTALLPLALAMLVGLCMGSSADTVATIIIACIATAGMLLSPVGWCSMSVVEFQPAGRQRAAVILLMVVISPMVLGSSAAALLLPPGEADWKAAAWLCTASLLDAELILLAGSAARVLFLLNHPLASRLLQSAQIISILATFILTASAAMIPWTGGEELLPMALLAALASALAMTLAMLIAAITFQSAA